MRRAKIVIFSPDEALATMVAEVVSDIAKVICCTTATQTIAQSIEESPDLVIVLSVSPFIDGSNLIEQIRQSSKRHPPIYVIAWQQTERMVLSLLECGVDQYMTFPISIQRLRGKVSSLIKTCCQ